MAGVGDAFKYYRKSSKQAIYPHLRARTNTYTGALTNDWPCDGGIAKKTPYQFQISFKPVLNPAPVSSIVQLRRSIAGSSFVSIVVMFLKL